MIVIIDVLWIHLIGDKTRT